MPGFLAKLLDHCKHFMVANLGAISRLRKLSSSACERFRLLQHDVENNHALLGKKLLQGWQDLLA